MTNLRHDRSIRGARTLRALEPRNTRLSIEMPAFYADATCPQIDNDLWFPEKGGTSKPAKTMCQGCPVINECLEWALEHEERFGIWGGKSERERRKISHERKTAAKAAEAGAA